MVEKICGKGEGMCDGGESGEQVGGELEISGGQSLRPWYLPISDRVRSKLFALVYIIPM